MKETGEVTKIKGNLAEIILNSKPLCETCKLCLYTKDYKRKIYALNKIGASIGDKVEVYISPQNRIIISLLLYFLPVSFFLIFYIAYIFLITKFLHKRPSEIIGAVCGIIGIFLTLPIIKLSQKFMMRKNYIISIKQKTEN